jgi:hypothetical protein
MVARNRGFEKRERALVFTFELAGRHNFTKASAPPQST